VIPTATGPAQALGELRVLLADKDPLARRAVRDALLREQGFAIAAEAADGVQAVASALQTAPDIVLMDPDLPRMDGLVAMTRILQELPDTRVVIFSVAEHEARGLQGLRAGASGFLIKDMDLAGLGRALRAVARGELAVPRRLTPKLIQSLLQNSARMTGMRPVRSPLTTREWEVLDLLSIGEASDEIAVRLGMSAQTTRAHVNSILRKLDVTTRAQAIEAAQRLRGAGEQTRARLALGESDDEATHGGDQELGGPDFARSG
jgi:DNA-binding NarL/FixJ family response regulator